jgi:hypothetical protein
MLSAIPFAVRIDSAKIRVKISAPSRLDHRLVILRSENDVIVQAQVC